LIPIIGGVSLGQAILFLVIGLVGGFVVLLVVWAVLFGLRWGRS
jgi:hypothetical protein